jgi:hypothetical protein
MVGTGLSVISRSIGTYSSFRMRSKSTASRLPASCRSWPEQKARPAPVMTMQRAVACKAAQRRRNLPRRSRDSAFITSGRFSVTVPMPPASVTVIVVKVIAASAFGATMPAGRRKAKPDAASALEDLVQPGLFLGRKVGLGRGAAAAHGGKGNRPPGQQHRRPASQRTRFTPLAGGLNSTNSP